jgi:hypothetical protein
VNQSLGPGFVSVSFLVISMRALSWVAGVVGRRVTRGG